MPWIRSVGPEAVEGDDGAGIGMKGGTSPVGDRGSIPVACRSAARMTPPAALLVVVSMFTAEPAGGIQAFRLDSAARSCPRRRPAAAPTAFSCGPLVTGRSSTRSPPAGSVPARPSRWSPGGTAGDLDLAGWLQRGQQDGRPPRPLCGLPARRPRERLLQGGGDTTHDCTLCNRVYSQMHAAD